MAAPSIAAQRADNLIESLTGLGEVFLLSARLAKADVDGCDQSDLARLRNEHTQLEMTTPSHRIVVQILLGNK